MSNTLHNLISILTILVIVLVLPIGLGLLNGHFFGVWKGVGLGLLVVGLIWGTIVFICNAGTPIQFGPIPFFFSVIVFITGFLILYK